jgi:hypothetical protein
LHTRSVAHGRPQLTLPSCSLRSHARFARRNTWIAEVISKLNELNRGECELIAEFVNLEHLEEKGRKMSNAAASLQKAARAKAEAKRKAEEEAKKKAGLGLSSIAISYPSADKPPVAGDKAPAACCIVS